MDRFFFIANVRPHVPKMTLTFNKHFNHIHKQVIDDFETNEKFKEGDNKDYIKLLQKLVINTHHLVKQNGGKKKRKKEKVVGTNKNKIML
jgi:hypothetical protein